MTMSSPSSRAAATVTHCGPAAGTRAKRARSTPSSAAATAPRAGRPTAAHHVPAAEEAATRARAVEVAPAANLLKEAHGSL